MKHQLVTMASVLVCTLFAMGAHAQQGSGEHNDGAKKIEGNNAVKLTNGEVRKVDLKSGRLTLKHGPIENMNMGPMTMAFPVKDKSVLTSLKEGDKVKFAVENVEGKPTVTMLVP